MPQIRRFKDSKIQRFKDSFHADSMNLNADAADQTIQRFKNSRIQRFVSRRFNEFKRGCRRSKGFSMKSNP
jgi:hypothetical protein